MAQSQSQIPVAEVLLVGRRIRDVRQAQGLTQAELAGLSGTGVRFVADLERGKATVEFGRVLRVLQTLGIRLLLELP